MHVGTRHDGSHTLPACHQRRGTYVYCPAGSPGCTFVVEPYPDDITVFKQSFSAFDVLKRHLGGVTTIVWAGVATDCCIHGSAFAADEAGYCNIIPIEAVSASSCEDFAFSLKAMAKSLAEVVDLDFVLDGLLTPGALGHPDHIVVERARAWYRKQTDRLGDTTGLSLDDVLQRLRPAT